MYAFTIEENMYYLPLMQDTLSLIHHMPFGCEIYHLFWTIPLVHPILDETSNVNEYEIAE